MRSTALAEITAPSKRRPTPRARPAPTPASPKSAAGLGPTAGRAMARRWRAVSSRTRSSRRAGGRAAFPAWCASASAGAADRNAVEPQCRLADADRHALAVLAAGADAVVQREGVADHGDTVQVGRAVADQHRALDRRADFAVLDAVGLGALEHIFAGGDVDLAAAEIGGVDAVLNRGDDLAGIFCAGEHVSVGHARHRHMRKAFAAAVAGG